MSAKRGRPRHPDVLTPAEWAVADAVRHGMSGPQIARRRGVSGDAVKFHVANALDKLGLASRAELRSWRGVPAGSAEPGTAHQRRHPEAGPARSSLSSREPEVLRLLADGASNPDISKALYISRRTTEHHVEHILSKLAVTSRTAAVAYAFTHELLT